MQETSQNTFLTHGHNIVVYDLRTMSFKTWVIEYYKDYRGYCIYNIANNEELSEGYQTV